MQSIFNEGIARRDHYKMAQAFLLENSAHRMRGGAAGETAENKLGPYMHAIFQVSKAKDPSHCGRGDRRTRRIEVRSRDGHNMTEKIHQNWNL